jgi:hypothetical protein
MDEIKKEEGLLSRRSFLTGAALATAGVAVAGLAGCTDEGTGGDNPTGGDSAATAGYSVGDIPATWDAEADVVIAGGGITGLVAAIRARDLGASVIVVEANYACGGHSITSGGHVHLGGGTALQKKLGVNDSPELYYLDHTAPFATRNSRNIREIVWASAVNMPPAWDLLIENGWKHLDESTYRIQNDDDSIPRTITTDCDGWYDVDPIGGGDARDRGSGPGGLGLTRPLEASARTKGVQFYMNHHMDRIFRAADGNVVGLEASYTPKILPGSSTPLVDFDRFLEGNVDSTETIRVKAKKAVVVTTGGSSSNWEFHSFIDPRYGPEHAEGVGGDPFSFQDGSGEIACIDVGATLGGTEIGVCPSKARTIGNQYGYRYATFSSASAVWPLIRAYGLSIEARGSQDGLIYVNMLGERFWREDAPTTMGIGTDAYWDALMASVIVTENGETKRYGGPVWAIFDDDWRAAREWNVSGLPDVDIEEGYFYSANTLSELAGKIVNKYYEQHKMPPANLEATVARYNGFVDAGVDEDWERPNPQYKIQTPPFYAAWCPNAYHDCVVGILSNEKFQVLDAHRKVIPHLYVGGEAGTGNGTHGHGKVISTGYAIGTNVLDEPSI